MPNGCRPLAAAFRNAGCCPSTARPRRAAARCSMRCCPLPRRARRAKFGRMTATTVLKSAAVAVYDYRCTAGPHSKPFVEQHVSHSIAYVRKGSFGCAKRGQSFELVAGSLLIGHPGDEYVCSHDHHVCGDECLSFAFAPELVAEIGGTPQSWQIGCAPPLGELMVLGELAQAAADGRSDLGIDEIGHALAHRFVEV